VQTFQRRCSGSTSHLGSAVGRRLPERWFCSLVPRRNWNRCAGMKKFSRHHFRLLVIESSTRRNRRGLTETEAEKAFGACQRADPPQVQRLPDRIARRRDFAAGGRVASMITKQSHLQSFIGPSAFRFLLQLERRYKGLVDYVSSHGPEPQLGSARTCAV
jgi:hypothetical protein